MFGCAVHKGARPILVGVAFAWSGYAIQLSQGQQLRLRKRAFEVQAAAPVRAPGNIGKQFDSGQPQDAGFACLQHEARGNSRAGAGYVLEHGRTLAMERDQQRGQAQPQSRVAAATATAKVVGFVFTHFPRLRADWLWMRNL